MNQADVTRSRKLHLGWTWLLVMLACLRDWDTMWNYVKFPSSHTSRTYEISIFDPVTSEATQLKHCGWWPFSVTSCWRCWSKGFLGPGEIWWTHIKMTIMPLLLWTFQILWFFPWHKAILFEAAPKSDHRHDTSCHGAKGTPSSWASCRQDGVPTCHESRCCCRCYGSIDFSIWKDILCHSCPVATYSLCPRHHNSDFSHTMTCNCKAFALAKRLYHPSQWIASQEARVW